jgi:hypothetical protein
MPSEQTEKPREADNKTQSVDSPIVEQFLANALESE